MQDITTLLNQPNNVAELISALHRACNLSSLKRRSAEQSLPGYNAVFLEMKGHWQEWLDVNFPEPAKCTNIGLRRRSFASLLQNREKLRPPEAFFFAMAGLSKIDEHFSDEADLFWEVLGNEIQSGDVIPVQKNLFVQRFFVAKDEGKSEPLIRDFGGVSSRDASRGYCYPRTLANFVVITDDMLEEIDISLIDNRRLRSRFSDFDNPERGGNFVMASASVLPQAFWTPDDAQPFDLIFEQNDTEKVFWVNGYHPDRKSDVVDEILEVVHGLDEQGVQLLVLPELTVFQPALDAISHFLKDAAKHLRLVVAGTRHTTDDTDKRVNRTCLLHGLNFRNEVDSATGLEAIEAQHEKFGKFSVTDMDEGIYRRRPHLKLIRLPIGAMSLLICSDVLDSHSIDIIKKVGCTLYCVPSMSEKSSGFANQFGNLSHFHQPIIVWANCCGVHQKQGEKFQPRHEIADIRMPVEKGTKSTAPTGCLKSQTTVCSNRCMAQIVRISPDGSFTRERWG